MIVKQFQGHKREWEKKLSFPHTKQVYRVLCQRMEKFSTSRKFMTNNHQKFETTKTDFTASAISVWRSFDSNF